MKNEKNILQETFTKTIDNEIKVAKEYLSQYLDCLGDGYYEDNHISHEIDIILKDLKYLYSMKKLISYIFITDLRVDNNQLIKNNDGEILDLDVGWYYSRDTQLSKPNYYEEDDPLF